MILPVSRRIWRRPSLILTVWKMKPPVWANRSPLLKKKKSRRKKTTSSLIPLRSKQIKWISKKMNTVRKASRRRLRSSRIQWEIQKYEVLLTEWSRRSIPQSLQQMTAAWTIWIRIWAILILVWQEKAVRMLLLPFSVREHTGSKERLMRWT